MKNVWLCLDAVIHFFSTVIQWYADKWWRPWLALMPLWIIALSVWFDCLEHCMVVEAGFMAYFLLWSLLTFLTGVWLLCRCHWWRGLFFLLTVFVWNASIWVPWLDRASSAG